MTSPWLKLLVTVIHVTTESKVKHQSSPGLGVWQNYYMNIKLNFCKMDSYEIETISCHFVNFVSPLFVCIHFDFLSTLIRFHAFQKTKFLSLNFIHLCIFLLWPLRKIQKSSLRVNLHIHIIKYFCVHWQTQKMVIYNPLNFLSRSYIASQPL